MVKRCRCGRIMELIKNRPTCPELCSYINKNGAKRSTASAIKLNKLYPDKKLNEELFRRG